MNVLIRPAGEEDIQAVLHVERQAFGREGEAQVVRELLADSTARPLISLLAFEDEKPVGHILLTSAALEGEHSHAKILLLAPLAVLPAYQKRGIGGALTREALARASEMDVDLVFVLGHPEYYIRYRFTPAGQHGFETPYPILPENADAWMVTELKRNKINEMNGRVLPAEVFRRPEHWRE
jgi:putative acetyltransferase